MPNLMKYKANLSPHQLDILNEYVHSGERDKPLAFHGRREILDSVSTSISAIIRRKANGDNRLRSRTHVVSGAPGSGKTSLLDQIKDENEGNATVVCIDGSTLISRQMFVEAIARKLGTTVDDKFYQKTTSAVSAAFSKVISLGANKVKEKEPRILREFSHWEILEDTIEDSDRPVVLCIDESQDIPVNEFSSFLVRELHRLETGNLDLMPVFGGLSNTRDTLTRLGLSRLNHPFDFRIGALSPAESSGVVRDTLTHASLGLSEDVFTLENLASISSLLTDASDCWPRHLDFYVKGVLRALYQDQTSPTRGDTLDVDQALEYGNSYRVKYCDDVMDPASNERLEKLFEAISMLLKESDRIPKDRVRALTRELAHLPDSEDLSGLLDHCNRKGIIVSVGKGDHYSVPIPSLKTYITTDGSSEEVAQILLEKIKQSPYYRLRSDFDYVEMFREELAAQLQVTADRKKALELTVTWAKEREHFPEFDLAEGHDGTGETITLRLSTSGTHAVIQWENIADSENSGIEIHEPNSGEVG